MAALVLHVGPDRRAVGVGLHLHQRLDAALVDLGERLEDVGVLGVGAEGRDDALVVVGGGAEDVLGVVGLEVDGRLVLLLHDVAVLELELERRAVAATVGLELGGGVVGVLEEGGALLLVGLGDGGLDARGAEQLQDLGRAMEAGRVLEELLEARDGLRVLLLRDEDLHEAHLDHVAQRGVVRLRAGERGLEALLGGLPRLGGDELLGGLRELQRRVLAAGRGDHLAVLLDGLGAVAELHQGLGLEVEGVLGLLRLGVVRGEPVEVLARLLGVGLGLRLVIRPDRGVERAELQEDDRDALGLREELEDALVVLDGELLVLRQLRLGLVQGGKAEGVVEEGALEDLVVELLLLGAHLVPGALLLVGEAADELRVLVEHAADAVVGRLEGGDGLLDGILALLGGLGLAAPGLVVGERRVAQRLGAERAEGLEVGVLRGDEVVAGVLLVLHAREVVGADVELLLGAAGLAVAVGEAALGGPGDGVLRVVLHQEPVERHRLLVVLVLVEALGLLHDRVRGGGVLRIEAEEVRARLLGELGQVVRRVERLERAELVARQVHALLRRAREAVGDVARDGAGVELPVLLRLLVLLRLAVLHGGLGEDDERLDRLGDDLRKALQDGLVLLDRLLEPVLVVEHVGRLELLLRDLRLLRGGGGVRHLEAELVERLVDLLVAVHRLDGPGVGRVLDVDVHELAERKAVELAGLVLELHLLLAVGLLLGLGHELVRLLLVHDAHQVAHLGDRGEAEVVLAVLLAGLDQGLLELDEHRHVVLDELLRVLDLALDDLDVRHQRDGAAEPHVLRPEQGLDGLVGARDVAGGAALAGVARDLDERLRVVEEDGALHVRRQAVHREELLQRVGGLLVLLLELEHLRELVVGVHVELDDLLRRRAAVLLEEGVVGFERLVVPAAGEEVVRHRELHRPGLGGILVRLLVDDRLRLVELAQLQDLLEHLDLELGLGGGVLGLDVAQDEVRVVREAGAVQGVDVLELLAEDLRVLVGDDILGADAGGEERGERGRGEKRKGEAGSVGHADSCAKGAWLRAPRRHAAGNPKTALL